jgi:hypothetical protein
MRLRVGPLGEMVPGVVSPAQMPRPFPPFGLSPPPAVGRVGGCLKDFAPFWRNVLDCSPFILEAVIGFHPQFSSPPPLPLPGLKFESPSQGKNNHFIDEEVEALLAKGAIEEVPLSPPSLSYISPIFLIPKKDGGMRPIFNLKKLNAAHLDTPYFRIETVEDVCHALWPGDWATSIDLRDAYFHIPLHPSTRKYMRFGWKGRLFQFLVLPFGLSPAPKVFTSLTRVVKVNFGLRHPGGGMAVSHPLPPPPPPPPPVSVSGVQRKRGSLDIPL